MIQSKLNPIWRIRAERIFEKLVGMRLRTLVNSPRLSSRVLHQQALRVVGAGADGKGGVMFDVGAHTGETALALALEFPAVTIHAFEPVQAIYNQLQENCRKYPNIVCHHAALGAKSETRTIALRSGEIGCTMNQMSHLAGKNTPSKLQETVTILQLDEVCRQFSVSQIAFLKIDVEGFELEVLRGAMEMLKLGRIQHIIAEVTFLKNSEQHVQFDDVRAMLEPLGYVFAGYYDPAYRPETGRLIFSNALFAMDKKII
jgi:FkbM family methyltransferase